MSVKAMLPRKKVAYMFIILFWLVETLIMHEITKLTHSLMVSKQKNVSQALVLVYHLWGKPRMPKMHFDTPYTIFTIYTTIPKHKRKMKNMIK